ncbi:MAG TPA: hypothetical protein VFN97_10540 [Actinospica sp.]|nr:hypothetical protein [Actinospica sp.]
MDHDTNSPNPAVDGLTDTRRTPLHHLAEQGAEADANLRHVLPADDCPQVDVAAFNSSI